MKLIQLLLLAFLSGFLMFFGWPNFGFFPFLFVGIVPVFFGMKLISKWEIKRWKKGLFAFLFSGLSHSIFVGLSSYWLKTTSPKTWMIGVFFSFITAGLFLFFTVFINAKRKSHLFLILFISLWIFMEYFNQNWMIGSPYFILGSGFGMHPKWVQFYSIIGIEGGTLWVLLSNGFLFLALENWLSHKKVKQNLIISFCIIVFPLLFSFLVKTDLSDQSKIEVGVLHTYFDPYQTKLTEDGSKAVALLGKLSEKKNLSNIDILIWPETALANMGWKSNLNQERTVQALSEWKNKYPKLTVSTGGYAFSVDKSLEDNPYARYVKEGNYSFETHNVSLTISDNHRNWLRSKEKFVPFQERIPFLHSFPWLENFADYVGSNTMVSLLDDTQQIHSFGNGKYSFTPVLCYESIFPLFMAEKAKDNTLIVIQANELWNKNPYGSRQYLYNSVLMAIQANMPILRSSNNGASAIIDANGKILDESNNKHTKLMIQKIQLNDHGSFYLSIRGYTILLALAGLLLVLFAVFNKREDVKK